MKFVLVINLNDDVAEAYEDFTVDYDLRGTPKEDRTVNESIKYIEDAEPKPLPPRVETMRNTDDIKETYRAFGYCDGWNDCLNEIVGDKEWKASKVSS